MNKYFYLIFLLIVGFTSNDVHKEIVHLEWNIIKNDGFKTNDAITLSFKNAEYHDSENKIPVYSRIFSLKDAQQNFNFTIENQVFEEVELPNKISSDLTLSEELVIESRRFKSAGKYYVELVVVPMKLNGDKVSVLKSFEIKRMAGKLKSAKRAIFNWKSESILKQGSWKKIRTAEKGIYKIPYTKLNEWGFSNPASVNVFGSGGRILSENPGEISYDDLEQIAVWHGKSNGADCLFFYDAGCTEWTRNNLNETFEHKTNNYSTSGYYFLTDTEGISKIAEKLPEIQEVSNVLVSTFNAYQLHEKDLENVLPTGSGRQWFGEKFRNNSNTSVQFSLNNVATDENVTIKINAIARSFKTSELKVKANQTEVGSVKFNKVFTSSVTSLYANEKSGDFSTQGQEGAFKIDLSFSSDIVDGSIDDNAIAWLDYVTINYRKNLIVENNAMFFRDINSVEFGNIAEFSIGNANSNTKVFDISIPNQIKEIPIQLTGSVAKMKRPANELIEYVVFNTDASFPEPEFVGEVQNQNLHGISTPEFIVISHSDFINSASALADFHRNYDGMEVEVVAAEQVYNEFSSGAKSATGIRNFIKMLYDRNEGLKYVLLFGDGSYDNKGVHPESRNYIPTYQSENSLSPTGSFVTDDFYAIMDADESVYFGSLDLGIGRIPASTSFEAELVVNKIVNYHNPEALGDWRNVVCFIGDDQDGNLHMEQSEELANHVNDNYREFITDKIYFDAYPQENTPAGERYPGVTDAINKRVKDGVLILNYVGHANERFMADEHVLEVSNINSWSNANNLPIFVTATCEFSRFDADETSAGEYILLNPSGGGIGLFSTTRVVFASSNFTLSKSFYNFIFEKNEQGKRYRLGDIIRLAKSNIGNSTNKRNFSLLADPALRLSYPKNRIITSKINGEVASSEPDTLGALQKIDIEGYVADYSGNKLNDFSGEIAITVYDKESMMKTLGNHENDSNDPSPPMEFKVQENIIYKGLASVSSGDFAFSFVVPKDISYNLGNGKIMYYAKNENDDAHGAFENFVIGGSSNQTIVDNQGPDIQLFMDSRDFVSGDKTGKNPSLLAFLSDENGINTVGTGIGHDITAILDDDYSNVLVLNNFYQANINDYTSGVVEFPFQNLSVGVHKLTLKAWDVANNSSEATIEFEVSGDFQITSVRNYPNPANTYTSFIFEHNESDAYLYAIVEIFDQTGKRVEYIETQVGSDGKTSNPIRWDLSQTNTVLRNGIFVYRVMAQNSDGVIATKSGKMIVVK